VLAAGLEPAPPFEDVDLNHARLPIPPRQPSYGSRVVSYSLWKSPFFGVFLPYVALNLNQARLPVPPTFARFHDVSLVGLVKSTFVCKRVRSLSEHSGTFCDRKSDGHDHLIQSLRGRPSPSLTFPARIRIASMKPQTAPTQKSRLTN
jgi:hypothetical protein